MVSIDSNHFHRLIMMIVYLLLIVLVHLSVSQTCDNDPQKTIVEIDVVTSDPTEQFYWKLLLVSHDPTEDEVLVSGRSTTEVSRSGDDSNVETACIPCNEEYLLKVISIEGSQPVGNITVGIISENNTALFSTSTGFASFTNFRIPCVCDPQTQLQVQLVVEHKSDLPEGRLAWAITEFGEDGSLFAGTLNTDSLICLPCDSTVFVSALQCLNTRSCSSYPFKLLDTSLSDTLISALSSDDIKAYPYTVSCQSNQ